MNILKSITDLIKSTTGLLDEVITTEEEKCEMQAKMKELELKLTTKVLEFEKEVVTAQHKIITAEINGGSWLQRNWRPLLMLIVICIIGANYLLFPILRMFTLDIPDLDLPEELFTLLSIGVGGYVVGRSGEKIASSISGKKSSMFQKPAGDQVDEDGN